jgi:peptide/nickel transport system substrate-binding protein
LTEFTFTLRKGHKWSDGQPFTTEDVRFWWEDIILNTELTPEVPSVWTFGGEPMQVEIVDEVTFKFITAASAPGMMPWLARTWILPAAPHHWLEPRHIKYNPDINDEAVAEGKASWVDYFYTFHGEWMDSVHRWTERPALGSLGHRRGDPEYQLASQSLLLQGGHRRAAASLCDASRESYSQDYRCSTCKVINGEVDEKPRPSALKSAPVYKEHEADGNYTVTLSPSGSDGMNVAFNCTSKDPVA